MAETPVSLLARLRKDRSEDVTNETNSSAWQRWFDLYRPLLVQWLRRPGLQCADAEEVISEVLTTVVEEIAEFERGGTGSFRAWLRQVMVNRLRNLSRKQRRQGGISEQALADLASPDSELSRLWDREHDQFVLRRLLELIKSDFEPATWEAFDRHVLREEAAEQVAAALGLTVNAVRLAKFRVMKRMQEESRDLVS